MNSYLRLIKALKAGRSRSIQYIDLQYCDNKGYNIINTMEAYNIKSKGKCTQNTKILEIVI